MSNYITEAFKQLNLLEDVEDITFDASGMEELRSFLDDAAVDPDEEMEIYDLEAEAKEDLKKSYEGKVILECSVCHSNIFEDPINVSMNEEGLACQDIECPYCMSNEGYYIIGEVAPFNQEEADKFATEAEGEEDELDEVDIEGAADDIDDEDIIEESCNTKKLKEEWDEEFESEYDSIVDNNSLSKEEKDAALSKLFSDYGMNESMKLDGIKELYDEDEIRGVEELKGSENMKGSDEIRGDKYKEFLGESKRKPRKSLKEGWLPVNKISRYSKVSDDFEFNDKFEIRNKKTGKILNYSTNQGGINDDKVTVKTKDGKRTSVAKNVLKDEIDLLRKENLGKSPFKESIEDVTINTEDETMTMTTKEDGGVVVETSPKESIIDDFDMDIEEPVGMEDSGEEMIVPVSDETSEVVDASIDALDDTDEEEFDVLKDETGEDEDNFDEFEEFDEESFDNLGESYLRNCYENVNSFKTSKVGRKGNKLFIEGIIGFDSGNKKKTNFVFETISSVNNNYKFEGYNKEISRGKKTFKLSGSLNNKKLTCESLNYNYRSKNELNESIRVYGTVRKK